MHSRQYISYVEGPPKFCIDLEADWLLILGEVGGKSPGIENIYENSFTRYKDNDIFNTQISKISANYFNHQSYSNIQSFIERLRKHNDDIIMMFMLLGFENLRFVKLDIGY